MAPKPRELGLRPVLYKKSVPRMVTTQIAELKSFGAEDGAVAGTVIVGEGVFVLAAVGGGGTVAGLAVASDMEGRLVGVVIPPVTLTPHAVALAVPAPST